MAIQPKLLVVDDEAIICQACKRVFSRQGFEVEETSDALEGLQRATQQDYDAILLDIKMPAMDGIRFLEELRKIKPDVPVMIMTGYPSIPNASSAVRLGAADYITKPFTPEEITKSLRRMLAQKGGETEAEPSNGEPMAAVAVPSEVPDGEYHFYDESWFRVEEDGSACVGTLPTRRHSSTLEEVQLPAVGDVVYRGLPMASLQIGDGARIVVPSPVSGVVVGINELVAKDPSAVLNEPLGAGWLVCVCTTRLEEDMADCQPRRVVLANSDEVVAEQQREHLVRLGCQVEMAATWDELSLAVEDGDDAVVVFDAASHGEQGAGLVGRINVADPSAKLVVVAAAGSRWEAAYREQKIFYYAVEPFADGEIVEVLNAAFRNASRPMATPERPRQSSEPMCGIRITNRNGTKVHLLAAPGLLRREDGLGRELRTMLVERDFPVETNPGEEEITATRVLGTAADCDRVMVLQTKDMGRLSGSLVRDTKVEYVVGTRENAGRVTTLLVQPDATGTGLARFDARTTAALAQHIVQEMATY